MEVQSKIIKLYNIQRRVGKIWIGEISYFHPTLSNQLFKDNLEKFVIRKPVKKRCIRLQQIILYTWYEYWSTFEKTKE